MKIDLLFSFSVTKEEEPSKSLNLVKDILVKDEFVELVFSHLRDKVWFTNKRIIALDVQGLTGSKKDYKSFPYSKITSFSIESAGVFDGDGDFNIWLSGFGVFGIKFRENINIKKIGKFIGEKLL